MGHLVREASLFDRGDGVTTTDDGDTVEVGEGVRDGEGSLGEGIHLEDAHRAVPDDGLALVEFGLEALDRVRTDVETHPALRNVVNGDDLRVGVRGELVGDDDVRREQELDALGFSLGHELLGEVNLVVLDEGGTDGLAERLVEGEDHATTEDNLVSLLQQGLDDANLGGHLGTADDGAKRALRVGDGTVEVVELLLEQETGDVGLAVLGHTFRGGVRAVRGTEGVVDEDGGGARELLREGRFVLLLLLVEASVLEQADGTARHGGDRLGDFITDAIIDLHHRARELFGQSRAHRGEAKLILRARLRATLRRDDRARRARTRQSSNTRTNTQKMKQTTSHHASLSLPRSSRITYRVPVGRSPRVPRRGARPYPQLINPIPHAPNATSRALSPRSSSNSPTSAPPREFSCRR